MAIYSGIVLAQASSQPMFAQIIDQVKRLVANGDWPPGSEIPSIRTLAADLSVSVITVKRAYAELEGEGIIATHQGRASNVAKNIPDLTLRLKKENLDRLLRQSAEAARQLGTTPQQLHEALDTILGEYYS